MESGEENRVTAKGGCFFFCPFKVKAKAEMNRTNMFMEVQAIKLTIGFRRK